MRYLYLIVLIIVFSGCISSPKEGGDASSCLVDGDCYACGNLCLLEADRHPGIEAPCRKPSVSCECDGGECTATPIPSGPSGEEGTPTEPEGGVDLPSKPSGGVDLPKKPSGEKGITVSDADKGCDVDEDCVLVGYTCSFCDCGEPVNRTHQERYHEMLQLECVDYVGGVCSIMCPPTEIKCVDKVCTQVEKDLSKI